uniref:ENTH domain-containing protein n=1 Tax=Ananas comosus var. bracteatus TaxID=296719 RepID=A0A6V7NU63_ANACO|nr:unnamed protein product [Ananas comosus var. bracteatus]
MSPPAPLSCHGTPFFYELKKQASSFLKDKIRTARLALTDVTPAELLTEEATNGTPWPPETKTMGFISRSAFEIDDYWRIVEILHKRFSKFDRKHWREPYKALVLLEHLLLHGPESVTEEFQIDKEFNWGLTVRMKSERVLKLLEKGPLLKEERDRARKVTRGIQGFGSFNVHYSPTNNHNLIENSSNCYVRSNSHYEDYPTQEAVVLDDQKESFNTNSLIHKDESGERSMEENLSDKSLKPQEETGSVFPVKGLILEESKPLIPFKEVKKTEFQKVLGWSKPLMPREEVKKVECFESQLLLSQS